MCVVFINLKIILCCKPLNYSVIFIHQEEEDNSDPHFTTTESGELMQSADDGIISSDMQPSHQTVQGNEQGKSWSEQ